MENKKKILVVNLGWEQEPMLEKLNEMDVDIYGVHYDGKYSKLCNYSDVLISDLRDLVKIVGYAERIKPDAVISDQCDYSYFAQAVISEKLGLPGPMIKDALIATNKYIQRCKGKSTGVLQPEFALCNSVEDAEDFLHKHGFPSIIKPLDNRGSFGVNRIDSFADLKECFYDSLMNSHSRQIIIEKFIEGTHITIDGYVFKNRGATSLTLASKILLKNKQVAMDILYPGEIDEAVYKKALIINENVNKSLGFTFGMTHSEYMIDKNNDIYLIETANRGGGCFTSEIIVPEVSNVDILNQYINDCMGDDDSYFQSIESNAVLLKFFSLNPGKFKSLKFSDKYKNKILKYRLNVKSGEEIFPISNDGNRHGFFIITDDKKIIRNTADMIINTMEVSYE